MSKNENAVKFTISMEPELRDWVDAKVAEMNRKDRRLKTSRSAIIADAVQSMRESEESGKAEADAGANSLRASESSAFMSSTRMKKNIRRAG